MQLRFSNGSKRSFVRFGVPSVLALLLSIQLGLVGHVSASETEEPMVWLESMQKAAVETNYRGTFVFSRGEMSSTVQVVHRYQDGVEEERLTQLDGAMGEVIRRDREVMCVLPNNKVVKVEQDSITNSVVQAFSAFMPTHEFYQLHYIGPARLIGREAVKLFVEAQDKNRYSYQLWLDRQTGLLLKSSLQGDGAELERFHYAEITFTDAITDEDLNPMSKGEVIAHEVVLSSNKDQAWPGGIAWKLDWVPPGFEPMAVHKDPGENVMLYSDGLATFSVFVEQVERDSMPVGASIVGATVAYFHKVTDGSHHYGVTVMGEVPAMTAMMVAESVKPLMTSTEP